MSEKEKQIFKLLILQAKYLKAQLEIDKGTFEEAQKDFAVSYLEHIRRLPKDEQSAFSGPTPDEQNPPKQKEKATPSLGKEVKKIYRSIALKSHPDRLHDLSEEEVAHRESLFKSAQEAIKNEDLLGLYDIATELRVDLPPPDEEQTAMIKKSIGKTRKNIESLKATAAWKWYHASSEKRENIMLNYLQYVYENFTT